MTGGPGWERLEAVFHDALLVAPEARAAWLDTACAGDLTLRRRVEALLASAAGVDRAHLAVRNGVRDLARQRPLTGQMLGAYRIVGELGRGGMGDVYLAERADGAYHGQVAIKVVRGGAPGEEMQRRFLAEREILAGLAHPYIARLLDAGETADGDPYMVMEHVDGLPIDRFCDAHVLDLGARLRLFAQVCEGVQRAHDHDVVHRDLKPANILVTEDGTPKLLDFGIAKVLGDSSRGSSVTTAGGGSPLTPSYGSPEQIRGEPVTPATDVYALGLVLYELLTGARAQPFADATPTEVARVICETTPDPPSVAAARRPGARPDGAPAPRRLAGDLDTITMMALRKEPARRYPDARALLDDLRRHLAGHPVHARRDSPLYRASRFVRRHRSSVFAAGLASLTVVASLVLWRERETGAAARDAVRDVTDLLSATAAGSIASAREDSILQRASALVRTLDPDPDVQLRLLDVLGAAELAAGRYDAANLHWSRALALRRGRPSTPDEEVSQNLRRLADLRVELGDAGSAVSMAAEALRLHHDPPGGPDDATFDVRESLARALSAAGQRDSALAIDATSLELALAQPAGRTGHIREARARGVLAEELGRAGRYGVAEAVAHEGADRTLVLPDADPRRQFAHNQEARLLAAARGNPGPFRFLPQQAWVAPVPGPRTALVADVTGDGLSDVVWNHRDREENALVVALGQPGGRFTLGAPQRHPDRRPRDGWSSYATLAADFDGDGASDLIWIDRRAPGHVYLATSHQDGSFDFSGPFDLSAAPAAYDSLFVSAADVTGDGRADLIWWNAATRETWIGVSRGAGRFTVVHTQLPAVPDARFDHWRLVTGDVDGNGHADLVWTGLGRRNRTWAGFVDAGGHVTWSSLFEHPKAGLMNSQMGVWNYYVALIGDVNGDRRGDLVWGDPASPFPPADTHNRVYVGESVDQGVHWTLRPLSPQDGAAGGDPGPFTLHAADVDGDGRADLLWNSLSTAAGANRVYVTRGLPSGRFDLGQPGVLHPALAPWSRAELFVATLNHDGRADLVWVIRGGMLRVFAAVAR